MPETKVLKFKEGRYEGEVNSAGDPEGEGCLEYPGNDEFLRQIYEGQFVAKKAHERHYAMESRRQIWGRLKEGLRHGKGEYWSKANGFKYVGDYKNDKKHGKGKYTYPNGDIYNGNWKNGVRHGKGKYSYKEDEGVYEGEWVEGIKQGSGKYTFGSGDVFTGTYENNVRHGEGKLVKVDGEERSENWKEGKLINFTITKEGKKKWTTKLDNCKFEIRNMLTYT